MPPVVPTYTVEDLRALGVTRDETDSTILVTIPWEAQKQFVQDALSSDSPGQTVIEIERAVLKTMGLEGEIKTRTSEYEHIAWVDKREPSDIPSGYRKYSGNWGESPKAEAAPTNTSSDSLIAERGKVYGDPELSHENIGLNWTGMIQQHYQLRLPHALPGWLVELMMAGFKIHRSARVYHEDNYDDLEVYGLRFAKEHQKKAFETC